MKTLNISISDLEYTKFNIGTEKLSFSDLVDIISRELRRQNLKKAVEISENFGLSKMTMEDISKEVKAVRENATDS